MTATLLKSYVTVGFRRTTTQRAGSRKPVLERVCQFLERSNGQSAIIRTERGLVIAGTRITLYDVMDYLKAQYPPKLIRKKLCLNDEQVSSALAYIESHREEVEAEYQEVLKTAEEIRQYWEEHNRERFAKIAAIAPKPGQEDLRAKLQAWKERIESQS